MAVPAFHPETRKDAMLKAIAFAAIFAIGGCEAARMIAPNTTAGFEEGGVLGALEGASGAVLATCQTFDGEVVRVAIDGLADATGTSHAVARIRAARQKACAAAGAIYVISDGLGGQTPAVSLHRAPPQVEDADMITEPDL